MKLGWPVGNAPTSPGPQPGASLKCFGHRVKVRDGPRFYRLALFLRNCAFITSSLFLGLIFAIIRRLSSAPSCACLMKSAKVFFGGSFIKWRTAEDLHPRPFRVPAGFKAAPAQAGLLSMNFLRHVDGAMSRPKALFQVPDPKFVSDHLVFYENPSGSSKAHVEF